MGKPDLLGCCPEFKAGGTTASMYRLDRLEKAGLGEKKRKTSQASKPKKFACTRRVRHCGRLPAWTTPGLARMEGSHPRVHHTGPAGAGISPILIGSYLIGLPFSTKGVALSGSLVLLAILPWMLHYAFRGTQLTLQRLGQALLCPLSLCLAGVFSAELALHLIAPRGTTTQLLVVAAGFGAAYSLSALISSVRQEAGSLKKLFSELRLRSQTA